jgi:YggT family protein
MTDFLFFIINGLFSFVLFMLFVSAIASWLVLFKVINPYNPTAGKILELLDRFTTPILAPFRAIIPPLGGVDISFIIAYLVISGIQRFLLPIAYEPLRLLIG